MNISLSSKYYACDCEIFMSKEIEGLEYITCSMHDLIKSQGEKHFPLH
jgi:hypothetical protein